MKNITNSDFLEWAAEAGLSPNDPRYPQSNQLVFFNDPHHFSDWAVPVEFRERAKFVETAISSLGDSPVRVRMRGGGVFCSAESDSRSEAALLAAFASAGIPADVEGAFEFDQTVSSTLVDLAIAFLSHGYCVGTDIEFIPANRHACLLLSHHDSLFANFSNDEFKAEF
jgi:hypothetical protein